MITEEVGNKYSVIPPKNIYGPNVVTEPEYFLFELKEEEAEYVTDVESEFPAVVEDEPPEAVVEAVNKQDDEETSLLRPKLGLYKKTAASFNNYPVFDRISGDQSLFVNSLGDWSVDNRRTGEVNNSLVCRTRDDQRQTPASPPVTGGSYSLW